MDLTEIRMRCLKMVLDALTVNPNNYINNNPYGWANNVIDRTKEVEEWILKAEQDALERMGRA